MKGWIRRTCVVCVIAMTLGASVVHADGGRIAFSGAVLTPTCSYAGTQDARPQAGRGGCGAAAGDASAYSSMYRQEVAPLEQVVMQGQDRLLTYFAGYAGRDDARLMTRTYD